MRGSTACRGQWRSLIPPFGLKFVRKWTSKEKKKVWQDDWKRAIQRICFLAKFHPVHYYESPNTQGGTCTCNVNSTFSIWPKKPSHSWKQVRYLTGHGLTTRSWINRRSWREVSGDYGAKTNQPTQWSANTNRLIPIRFQPLEDLQRTKLKGGKHFMSLNPVCLTKGALQMQL